MEKKEALPLFDAPSSPWDQAVRQESDVPQTTDSIVPWTREYNVETAVAEAEQCARTTRGTILWVGAVIDGASVFLCVLYGGVLLGFRHSNRDDVPVHREAVTVSHVVAVAALLMILMVGLRCMLLVWGIKYATVTNRERRMWTLDGARYCTVILLFLYSSNSILLLLFWNALHLDCIRCFLDRELLHSYWMIPMPLAKCIQRHSHQLYLPFLILCIIEAIRYLILRSYTESISPARGEEDNVLHAVGLEGDALRAPLLPSSATVPAARWWNSDYWTTASSPRRRPSTADLAQLHDSWARRSELEGPLWWSRDEEDIERDLLSTYSPSASSSRR
jgi:hypothetical protein